MSASLIYDLAPIGSIIAWSDGTPRPPERFKKKLAAWQTRNSKGRLIRKEGLRTSGNYTSPPHFTLHEADFGGKDVVVLRIYRTFGVDSNLAFKVNVRRSGRSASSTARAPLGNSCILPKPVRFDVWLSSHGYPTAVLQEVSADVVAADHVEGRTAA